MANPRRHRFTAWATRLGARLAAFRLTAALGGTRPRDPFDPLSDYVPPPWPPRLADGSIDWSDMNYVQITEVDYHHPAQSLDALLEGPMRRYFDLCASEAGVRGAARTMEFARGPVARFKERNALSEDEARAIDDIVMAELEQRFGCRGADGRYLIDVYLGKRNHNS